MNGLGKWSADQFLQNAFNLKFMFTMINGSHWSIEALLHIAPLGHVCDVTINTERMGACIVIFQFHQSDPLARPPCCCSHCKYV